MKIAFPFLIAVFFLFACSDKEDEYDKSKAISAFAIIDPIRVDPELEKTEIKIPSQKINSSWSGSASSQNALIENFSKSFSLKKSKKISLNKSTSAWFFYGGDLVDHFVFSPIIKDDKFFLLSTSGLLSAYNLTSEKKIWKTRVFPRIFLKNYQTPKIGYGDGKIFAIAGINKIAAVNEVDGKILWSKEISSIPVSAPVSDGKLVYVTTNDNKLYAFKVDDGELQYTQSGILRNTAILGAADPIIYKDLIIVSYSSGEVYALRKTSGEVVWSEDLNLSKATNSDFYLNDIDATPIAKDDMLYTIGNGGLMMAIKIKDGNYLWKKEIAGIVDFWLAGDFLFVINNENKLLAIHKKTGGVKWISQLPNLKKEKKPETKIIYSGLVMAGDRLVVSSAHGEILIISPFDGKIEKTFDVGQKIFHSPIIVNNKIYLQTIGKYTINLFEIE